MYGSHQKLNSKLEHDSDTYIDVDILFYIKYVVIINV